METTVSGVGIDVIYKGQRMEPPLNVAEACSGMRLLMAFLALGVAMAYLHYRPIWQRIGLLASTIPIARRMEAQNPMVALLDRYAGLLSGLSWNESSPSTSCLSRTAAGLSPTISPSTWIQSD